MQIPGRFTLALQIMICLESFKDECKLTSDFLAGRANANPVIIRKVFSQLKAAGLISVSRGRTADGAALARPAAEISFLDVYLAVECVEPSELFRFYEPPDPACPVCANIREVLADRLGRVQQAFAAELASHTLDEVLDEMNRRLH